MSVTEIHDFFAVLAIGAMVGTLVLVVVKVVNLASPNALCFRVLDIAHRAQLALAALVASVATLGSLYFSEINDPPWAPCRFCWFQRIFMYSSAVVLLMATFRRDRGVKWYVVPLATIGLLLSGWHNLIEHQVVTESASCAATGPSCAASYYQSFGRFDYDADGFFFTGFPITLAVMAFSAFAFILAVLLLPEPLDTTDALEDDNGEPAAS